MRNYHIRARRGVSLIEVLVVLVLLVLGILIIVRLFPSGFFSINSVGDAALADSLGQAAVQSQAQGATAIPESILTTAANITTDPSDPNTLNQANLVNKETVTIPAASGATRQSVYVVDFGPVVLGTPSAPIDPAGNVTQLPLYLTVQSPFWAGLAGDSTAAEDEPQGTIFPRQERFLADLANKKIAVPYASYTPTGATFTSYAQKFVVMILASDGKTYMQYLNVPPGTTRDTTNPYAPRDSGGVLWLKDTATNYQGGWFDPTATYVDPSPPVGSTPNPPPSSVTWQKVMLYRSYQPVSSSGQFSHDPYEFMLISKEMGASNANPGAISFNPLAASGSGGNALRAQISYQNYSWKILHEDRDIPVLPSGNTAVVRLTLKNLKRAGDANPDNTIYTGLASGGQSIVILDLDSGTIIGPPGDPTFPNDEDMNGTANGPTDVNVSFALGRLTFASNSFNDNPTGNTPQGHRVRIFYAGDADWTVAVQKAPSYYTYNATDVTGGADPMLKPAEFAFDPKLSLVYLPPCDAGKSVEVTGTYLLSGQLVSFADTVAISLDTKLLGTTPYVYIDLGSPNLPAPVPSGATSVTLSGVRGLSERAVVAWKERDRWKVHSVDVLLNRPQ